MALITCKECGHQVSDRAAICPKCGAPISAPPLPPAAPQAASAPTKRKTSGCAWAAAILIGAPVVLAVIGAFITTSKSPTPSVASAEPPPTKDAPVPQQLDEITKRLDDGQASMKTHYPSKAMINDASMDALQLTLIAASGETPEATSETKSNARRAHDILQRLEPYRRAVFASGLEEVFLKQGMSAKVTTAGVANKTLRVKYALMSQALAYKMNSEANLSESARNLGFEKIIYGDGLSSEQTWTIDLNE